MTIYVTGPRDKIVNRPPKGANVINCCSSGGWSSGLSPFLLGPVKLYKPKGYPMIRSQTMENAWQYCKVYKQYTDNKGNPNHSYWEWAHEGWDNPKAVRYPMGKGAVPLYSLWDGEHLDYIAARKKIYCPLYARLVVKTDVFAYLEDLHKDDLDFWLWDYDGYNHRALGMEYWEVLDCPDRKMGHAFVLAMLLEGKKHWEKT